MRVAACAILILAALAGACSAPASVDDTEREVAKFHHQLNAGDYASIWQTTGDDMRAATTESDMTKVFSAVNRKLGKVVETKQVGWRSNVTTSGSFTGVQMQTKFEKGEGLEDFAYRKIGDRLVLAGYHINSKDMMVN